MKFRELYKQCIAILKEHDTKMKAMVITFLVKKKTLMFDWSLFYVRFNFDRKLKW